MTSKERFTQGAVLALLIALGLSAGRSDAAFVTYANRAAFSAAVTPTFTETWDAFPNGTIIANGSTVNGITYNSPLGNAIVTSDFLPLTNPNTLGRSNNSNFFAGTDTITFTFATPINAFAINFNTFANSASAYTLTANIAGPNVAGSFNNPFPGFTTGQFAGFSTDLSVTSVTIASRQNFTFNLDNLSFRHANVVQTPEPASMIMLATGTVLVGGFARLRRKTRAVL